MYAISAQYRVPEVKVRTMTQKEGNNFVMTFLGSKANSSIALLQIAEKIKLQHNQITVV